MAEEYKLSYTASEIDAKLKKIDEIDNKEKTENKSTVINNNSTDEQYPSSKAVYDLVQEALYIEESDEL